MSKYQDKVLKGIQPDPSDWAEFLKAAHKAAPGMTPKAFDTPRTANGLNSYQVLVEAGRDKNRNPLRLLDLACGDGHLAGQGRSISGLPTAQSPRYVSI